MKRNPEFILREVAGTLVLVPVGQAAAKFSGMVTMNKTSAFLWEKLEQDHTVASLAEALVEHYEVELSKAQEDVEAFIATLEPTGAILED